MRKKLLCLALAVFMVFAMAACEVSSSSTSTVTVSTSTTDADGNTTTNTTTTEVGVTAGTDGVSTTNQTTTETTTSSAEEDADAEESLTGRLYERYNSGALGSNEGGDRFFYAFNEDNDDALLVIVTADGSHYEGWEGVVDVVDEHIVLTAEDTELPYTFSEVDEDGCFTMNFLGDGDVAEMQLVDFDSFVSELVASRMAFN